MCALAAVWSSYGYAESSEWLVLGMHCHGALGCKLSLPLSYADVIKYEKSWMQLNVL